MKKPKCAFSASLFFKNKFFFSKICSASVFFQMSQVHFFFQYYFVWNLEIMLFHKRFIEKITSDLCGSRSKIIKKFAFMRKTRIFVVMKYSFFSTWLFWSKISKNEDSYIIFSDLIICWNSSPKNIFLSMRKNITRLL